MIQHNEIMNDQEFYRLYTFLKDKYGIDMSKKKEIVCGRLDNYLRMGEWNNFTEYLNALFADKTGALEKTLVNMMTTNHTFFMREFQQFEYFKEVVLPEMKKKEMNKKDLHIWCGASSSGEEPYTIAMLLSDFFGFEKKEWDTTVLATDISTNALKQAVEGRYTAEQMEKVPDIWKRRYFVKSLAGETYIVNEELKKEVLFREFNLMNEFPFSKKMHVIFLRNVMIYFDDKTKKELLKKIYDILVPGGYLFIGQTETVDRETIPFTMVKPSIYRK